jgi:hypothetical protein
MTRYTIWPTDDSVEVYQTILTNVQSSKAAKLVPRAMTAAGLSADLSADAVPAFIAALPLDATALAKVPGVIYKIIVPGGVALEQAYVVGVRTTILSSLSFDCWFCNEIGPKMMNEMGLFL